MAVSLSKKQSRLTNYFLVDLPFPIQARSVLKSQVCSYCLNIGQDQLNVALTMSTQTKYW